jgi:hypothetical protein
MVGGAGKSAAAYDGGQRCIGDLGLGTARVRGLREIDAGRVRCGVGTGDFGNEAVDGGKKYIASAYWASGPREWTSGRVETRASDMNFGPIGAFGLFLIDARIYHINSVFKHSLPKFKIGHFGLGQFGFGLGFLGFGFRSSVFMPTPT